MTQATVRKGITLITLNDSTSVTWAKLRMGLLLLLHVIESITVPLLFEVYKPKERLKPADIYRSKPEIAAGMIRTQSNGLSIQVSASG